MKKALIATTAIVAAGLASSASAAEWSTRVTGYYFLGLGVLRQLGNQDGVAVLRDGEAHVRAKLVKADNGITFQARIELEAFTSGDQIDENYGTMSGSFGTILIGSATTTRFTTTTLARSTRQAHASATTTRSR